MKSVRGQISDRLRRDLPADDPAWTPPREADAPTTSRQPDEGRPITGRRR